MTLTGIVLPVVALGVLLMLLGIALVVKRIKTAGIIIALLGIAVMAVPVLGYVSVAATMR
jgi:hypothetical protein